MRCNSLAWAVVCVALALPQVVSAAEVAAKDPLKDAGLVRSGNLYVLPDDAAVVSGVAALRKTKLEADQETRARHAIDLQLAAKRRSVENDAKQWEGLQSKLSLVTDTGVHNRIVLRMNRLVADQKEALQAQKDLEEQAGKSSTTAKTKFVDDVAALNAKADAVAERYKTLANDPTVKAALAAINSTPTKVALGPTLEFTAAVAELKKWQSTVESEAIPLTERNGIHLVDALLNGEHFVLGLDTGASAVTLPAEIAEKLKMVPGDQDPTIKMQLADGNLIEGKQMTLKTVRVGRFTIKDVTCVVLQKDLKDAPLILGGSFLNHFIVRLDPAANELHLTQIQEDAPAKLPRPMAKPAPSADAN
ncbi:MAG TPA: retropepsin-like aspartic protease [Tepidisphaeraceae bacterium]|jgi:aspartyl protease family protein